MSTPEIDRPNGDADDGMGINKWLWQPRKGGQIYLRFRYRDLDGKSKQFSRKLHTNHLPTARRIRDTHFAPIILDMSIAQAQIAVAVAAWPELEDQLHKIRMTVGMKPKRSKAATTIQDVCDRWIKAISSKGGNYAVAPSTSLRYAFSGRSFVAFIGGKAPIDEITANHVSDYRDDRIENYGKSKKTVGNELSALRSMFRYAREKCGLRNNPEDGVHVKWTKVERRRAKRIGKRRPPTHTEADAICTDFPGPHKQYSVDDYQDYAMFARYTGMRQGEIAHLCAGDFNLYAADEFVDQILKNPKSYENPFDGDIPNDFVLCLFIADTDTRRTKTGLERVVPIADKLLPIVFARLKRAKGRALFPFAETDGGSSFGRKWLKLVKEIHTELTMHGFRHYSASEMENNGVSEAVSSIILGHVKDDVHDGYFHKQIRVLKEAVDKIY